MRLIPIAVACLTLAACAPGTVPPPNDDLMFLQRAWADSVSDQPFDSGPVSIVATEQGMLQTYALVPCRDGNSICAGSERGRVAKVQATEDFDIVSGIYGDRVFYLSPAGDGFVKRGSKVYPLAWEDNSDVSNWAFTRGKQ